MRLPRLQRSLLGTLLLAGCTPKPEVSPQEQAPQIPRQPLEMTAVDLPPRALPNDEDVAAEAPFQLTASDGTGLEVVSLKARAVVQGPLAFTELHLTFDNPQARTIEGRFQIDLPQGAAISRFAMKVASGWQEGEVVERQAARRVYEDFLHRRQDPALLEKQAGNRFSARVFPIPAKGRKELIVAYSQELPDREVPYSLMLAGLPKLESLDVQVLIDETKEEGPATSVGGVEATRRVIELKKEDYVPTADLRVEDRLEREAIGLRSGTLAVARVPVGGSMEPQPIEDLTILFDTSASQSLRFARKVRRLAALTEAVAARGDVRLRVIAFDNDVAKIFEGPARDFGDAQVEALYARRAMGASDLQRALERLVLAGASERVVLMTDGVATAGKSQVVELRASIDALGRAGMQRIDAVVDGGLRDEDVLAALTTALPANGVVVDADLPPSDIVSRLTRTTHADVSVSVPDASFVWPTTVSGVQPGDEMLVYAVLPEDAAMTVTLTGEHRLGSATPLMTKVERPLLERALVGARIDAKTLERSGLPVEDAAGRSRVAEEIVDLSTKHRVLSDFTALLVLETEDDYRRFDIDRNALADVLSVDAGGLTLLQREAAVEPTRLARRAGVLGLRQDAPGGAIGGPTDGAIGGPTDGALAVGDDDADVWGGLTGTEVGESFGAGGLGLVGTGRGGGGTGEGTIGLGNTGLIGKGGGGSRGFGRGSGAGFGGRGKRIPRVRQAKATVDGPLDKDIIRRIVRAHINEVRHCYDQGLTRDPNLSGRVSVAFTITATGRVSTAEQESSTTMPDRRVNACIVRATRRWKFPKPRGGESVEVVYPFVLGSGGGTPLPPETDEEREERLAREQAREESLRREAARRAAEEAKAKRLDGYEGKMLEVMTLLERADTTEALDFAMTWRDETPGDVLALLAVGEALEAGGQLEQAARAYGSLIDLFPARADLRRYAGYRLERVGKAGRRLAADTYLRAVEQRPDHPNSHRLLAYALLRDGQLEAALDAIETGVKRNYPSGRFAGVTRILREDMSLIAAAVVAEDPGSASAVKSRLDEYDLEISSTPSTRFIMSWETDANDVDFHIHDGEGGHAYFSDRALASGGRLYADVTTGYGPECFTIEGEPAAFPYRFEANYYSRGPMGYGMGKLELIRHDGKGGLTFEPRPFVIMKDRAYVPLGTLEKPLSP